MTRPTLHQWSPSTSATSRARSTPAVRWRPLEAAGDRLDQGELGDQQGRQGQHRRLRPGQEQGQLPGITAARVVLAVRRPSGEPSRATGPAAAGRPAACLASAPTGAASAARTRPVRRRHRTYPGRRGG